MDIKYINASAIMITAIINNLFKSEMKFDRFQLNFNIFKISAFVPISKFLIKFLFLVYFEHTYLDDLNQ